MKRNKVNENWVSWHHYMKSASSISTNEWRKNMNKVSSLNFTTKGVPIGPLNVEFELRVFSSLCDWCWPIHLVSKSLFRPLMYPWLTFDWTTLNWYIGCTLFFKFKKRNTLKKTIWIKGFNWRKNRNKIIWVSGS